MIIDFIFKIFYKYSIFVFKYVVYFLSTCFSFLFKYTWVKLLVIITLLASFLTIRHSYFGLILWPKHYVIYNVAFQQPSKIYIESNDQIIINNNDQKNCIFDNQKLNNKTENEKPKEKKKWYKNIYEKILNFIR